jgi:hypothetical protein
MKINRKILIVGGAVAALAAGGIGIAYAVGGESEEQVTGPNAEKAKAAALDRVGGGTVLEVERQDGDGSGVYEVEVQRPDGSQVEVHVSGNYDPVGTAADDDSGSSEEEESEEGEGADK